jgi:hypothetical protein
LIGENLSSKVAENMPRPLHRVRELVRVVIRMVMQYFRTYAISPSFTRTHDQPFLPDSTIDYRQQQKQRPHRK